MARDEIRIVEMGDGTAVWVRAGDAPQPPARKRRWPLWAGIAAGLSALAAAALAFLL